MKNNKKSIQTKTIKSKKRYFLTFGAAILAAAAIATPTALILTRNAQSGKYTITYDAGAGKFASGETTITVGKNTTFGSAPTPIIDLNSTTTTGSFCGWAKTTDLVNGKVKSDKIIKASDAITSSCNLVAVFKNTVSNASDITWCKVTFNEDAEKKATVTGNTFLEVPKNTIKFKDINHPSVSVVQGCKFKWWGKTDGTEFTAGTVISEDVELKVVVEGDEKLTFDANGGTITQGEESITYEVGQKFGSVNPPRVEWQATGTRYFGGWFSDSSLEEKYRYNDETVIVKPTTGSTTAYARWVETPSELEAIIHVLVPDGETTITAENFYDSNTTFIVTRGVEWKTFNRPNLNPDTTKNPRAIGEKIKSWQISTDQQTWTDVTTDTYPVPQSANVYIRPVMVSQVTEMLVYDLDDPSSTTFKTGVDVQLQCKTYPEKLSQKTSAWKVYKVDSTGTETECGSSEATITRVVNTDKKSTAKLNVKSSDIDKIVVRATSNLDGTSIGKATFTKTDPYVQDVEFFTTINGVSYELTELYNKYSTTIKLLSADGKKTVYKTVNKSDFNYPVYISDKVTQIPNDFLSGCSSFNSAIKTKESTHVMQKIGDNFLKGATSFNNASVKEILESATEIGDNCMYDNQAFNACGLSLATTGIGENFFAGNIAFNQTLTFANATKIGNHFLSGCSVFNQDITFPQTLTTLGCACMNSCNAFTSVITFEANPEQTLIDKNIAMFSTNDSTAAFGTTGFTFAGTYAEKAHEIWFDLPITGTIEDVYRKSVVEEAEELPSYLASQDVPSTTGDTIAISASTEYANDLPAELTIKSRYKIGSETKKVVKILNSGFYQRTVLTKVTLPNSLLSIGENAFAGTNITSFTIPNSVVYIATGALSNDSTTLQSLSFENTTSTYYSTIGETETVAEVSTSATENATKYNTETTGWRNGKLFIKTDYEAPSNLKLSATTDYSGLVVGGAESTATSVTINSQYTFEGVTAYVTEVGSFSAMTALTSITLPSTILKIDGEAFFNNEALTTITIPASCKEIDAKAFHTKMTSIVFEDKTKTWIIGTTEYSLVGKDDATITAYFKQHTEESWVMKEE